MYVETCHLCEKEESTAGASATSESLKHEEKELELRDRGKAELDHPPAKRTALEDLLGDSPIQSAESNNKATDQ